MHKPRVLKITRRLTLIATGLALAGTTLSAQAEGRVRIAQQFGIVYLMLNVAQDQKLIEKHAKAAGWTPRWSSSSCLAAPPSTTRCCPATSTLQAPGLGPC